MEHLHSLLSLLDSTHSDKTKSTAPICFSVVNDLRDLDDTGLLEELREALAVDVVGQVADVDLGLLGRLDVLPDLLLVRGLLGGGGRLGGSVLLLIPRRERLLLLPLLLGLGGGRLRVVDADGGLEGVGGGERGERQAPMSEVKRS